MKGILKASTSLNAAFGAHRHISLMFFYVVLPWALSPFSSPLFLPWLSGYHNFGLFHLLFWAGLYFP